MKLKDIIAFLMKHKILMVIVLLIAIFIIIRYASQVKAEYYYDGPNNISPVEVDGEVPERITLPQAWSDQTREEFWFTSQGSQIMPYTWFLHLEVKDTQQYFRSSAFIEKLGYLPEATSDLNPGGLPIGFAITRPVKNQQHFMGFTCAACHTNQLDYKGTKLLIEGAPTLANFVLFWSEIVHSLDATHRSDDKFKRFSEGVLGKEFNEERAADLRKEVKKLAIATAERQAVNALPSSFPDDFTSYARLDAFGNIANAGSAFGLHDLANKNPPSGPVSYPFLWGTHQSDVVQWNASAPNTPVVGPLVRNVGEVVGVFGGLSISEAPWWQKILGIPVAYESTVDFQGLGKLETWIKEMRSPEWPEEYFPDIDINKAARGSILFADKCAECHQVIKREDEGLKYKSNRTPLLDLGTDPVTAWNIENHTAKTGILEGIKEQLLIGDKFGPTTRAISLPINGVVGVVLKRPIKAIEAGLAPSKSTSENQNVDLQGMLEKNAEERAYLDTLGYASGLRNLMPPSALGSSGPQLDLEGLVYKGRPLNGIWATAPYLHNGSIPNLWQLLQIPSERVTSFKVGSREFQPDSIGFVTDVGPSTFNVLDANGKIIPGNSNRGHAYGAGMTDDEKWDLIEYMKTL